MYIKPAEGKTVHDPFRQDEVPAKGRNVEPNQHWLKQVREGAVIQCDPPADEQQNSVEEKANA